MDRALDKWKEQRKDVYSLARELAELIKIFHPRRKYLSIALEGFQGTGKTTFSILLAKEVLGSWEDAFSVIRFDLDAFINETQQFAEVGYRPIIRILDDFAFQGASKWRRTSEQNDLLEYMQVIRTVYTSLVYSYVDDSVAKFFRINAKIKIIFNMVTPDVSELIVYSRRRSIMGTYYKRVGVAYFDIAGFRRENPEFVELYSMKYEPERRKYMVKKGQKLKERMDRRKQLFLAGILGFYAAKSGRTILDLASYLRSLFDISIDNNELPKLSRKAKEYLGIISSPETRKDAHSRESEDE